MKILVMAGMAVLLLGGGAAGAYFFLNKPAEAATATPEHEQAVVEGEGAVMVPAVFVELDPLILPIVDHNGVSQTVSLVVSVEVADEAAASRVKNLQPRLKDAFIQDMYGELSRKSVMAGGVLEVGKLKARLNRISGKVMGDDTIKEVLLQVVQQRRI